MSGTVIIGAGPGIGVAVARRFAREGHAIGLVARTARTVDASAGALAGNGVPVLALTADAADEDGLRAALDEFARRFGVPDVLVYNAAVIRGDRPGELGIRSHQETWAVNVGGAIAAAAHTLPAMAARGQGTYLLTGGMPLPDAGWTSLSLGKAGVRTLTALLAQEYGPAGVHVATVTVAGAVGPGTAFDPDDIAEHYWRLHGQPEGQRDLEIRIG
jgi:NAD(P)-dependent dehydrogenase (short-subunit alcohol dehydrogenase family)